MISSLSTVEFRRSAAVAALSAALALAASMHLTPALAPAVLVVFKLLVVAPVIEELFFRGVIQAALLRQPDWWGRPLAANAITAIAFGLTHLAFSAPPHALAVALPALVIGGVYQRTRSILLCIASHSAFNAVYLFWSHPWS